MPPGPGSTNRIEGRLVVGLIFMLGACDPKPPPSGRDALCDLLPGDLVITEIMPNPKGDDAGEEWIEIYNTTDAPLHLDRIVLELLGTTAVEPRAILSRHTVRGAGLVEPHAYFALGKGTPGIVPIDYSYGLGQDTLRELNNTIGGVALVCKGVTVDEVWYGTQTGAPAPTDGASLTFDGGLPPDANLNDEGRWWCASPETYDGINRGTPRAKNALCGRGTCFDFDTGEPRLVVPPQPGGLVVTEVFPDPQGADSPREWIELYVAAAEPVDLNGLALTSTVVATGSDRSVTIEGIDCLTAEPGTYVVLGAAADVGLNGDVAVDFEAPELNLFNDAEVRVEVDYFDTPIDVAVVPAAPADDGISVQLDPTLALSAPSDDGPSAYCTSKTKGLFNGTGTPGRPNDPCPGSCLQAWTLRAAVAAQAGGLIINEVFNNPTGTEGEKEWLEVYVAASSSIDLNGVKIVDHSPTSANTYEHVLDDIGCMTVGPGSFVVIGSTRDPALNGHAPVQWVPLDGTLSLYNVSTTGQTQAIELYAGSTLVDVAVVGKDTEGSSSSLNPTLLTPSGNDVAIAFCPAKTTGLFDEIGTPGAANDSCP